MTAVAHAVRHPERVSKLILHGGKARGALAAEFAEKTGGNV